MTAYEEFSKAAKAVDLTMTVIRLRNDYEKSGEKPDYRQINKYQDEIESLLNSIGSSGHLGELKKLLSINQKELALLILAALPYHNLQYKQVYAMLSGDANQNFPTINLLISLVSKSWEEQQELMRRLLSRNPLLFWRFLIIVDHEKDFFGSQVCIPTDVLHFLLDSRSLDTDCNSCLYILTGPKHKIIPAEAAKSIINNPYQIMALQGPQGIGRKTQAIYLSGKDRLFALNNKRFLQFDDPIRVIKDILRLLILLKANLYCPFTVRELCETKGIAEIFEEWFLLRCGKIYFAEREQVQWPGVFNRFKPGSIELKPFEKKDQIELWRSFSDHYLKKYKKIKKLDWEPVVDHYQLAPRLMHQVCVRLSQDFHFDMEITLNDIVKLCKGTMQSGLSNLAVRHCSERALNQIVLNDETREQLEELIYYSHYSPTLKDIGLRENIGVQVLFWGPSGTGKTLAATVVANELNRPLYKADLSNIASKWIGETEKHLAKLFDQAEQNNGVLFFDEADSVFGKRSNIESSHDKNANMGVSYLLQRIENYNGVLILASNFKGNLDKAFLRRFQQSIEFPMPGEKERLALWKAVWSDRLRVEPSVNLESLAEMFELSGANIKNIATLATLMALKEESFLVKENHIARGIKREYQKLDNGYWAEQRVNQWLGGQ